MVSFIFRSAKVAIFSEINKSAFLVKEHKNVRNFLVYGILP